MGLLARSASFVRYAVEGELPANFWEFAAERIARHSFRDIDESYEELSIGWVSVLNMFDSEFAYASYAAADHVVLSLRIDERRVSPKVLNKFCLKEEERLKRARQIPKLARAHRVEIKESVKLMLMKRRPPPRRCMISAGIWPRGRCCFFPPARRPRSSWRSFSSRPLISA